MVGSSTSGVGTSGTGNVTLISANGLYYNRLVIANKGTTDGFFSIDGGTNWGYIPAATTAGVGMVEWWGKSKQDVLIKRASTDLTNVFGFVDWLDMD